MLDDFLERLEVLKAICDKHGRKLAVVIVLLLLAVLGKCLYGMTPLARVALVRANMRAIGAGLEAYHNISTIYPITPKMVHENPGVLSAFSDHPEYHFQDFTILSSSAPNTNVQQAGRDPFARGKSLLGYEVAVNERTEFEWILTSVGPDHVRDVDLADFSSTQRLFAEKIGLIYDPTNGMFSRGDIVYTRELHLRQP